MKYRYLSRVYRVLFRTEGKPKKDRIRIYSPAYILHRISFVLLPPPIFEMPSLAFFIVWIIFFIEFLSFLSANRVGAFCFKFSNFTPPPRAQPCTILFPSGAVTMAAGTEALIQAGCLLNSGVNSALGFLKYQHPYPDVGFTVSFSGDDTEVCLFFGIVLRFVFSLGLFWGLSVSFLSCLKPTDSREMLVVLKQGTNLENCHRHSNNKFRWYHTF